MDEFLYFLMENWYLIVVFIAMVVVAVFGICRLFDAPTKEQIENVREWLVGVCTQAEKELGSGTGQLKLRQVYDLFVVRFPWLAKVIPFRTFSEWVDDALVIMRDLLAKNEAVQDYVGVVDDE